MNISELTTDAQVHLFNRLHLSDLYRLRTLCRSLNASFFVHARSRHSLSIKVGRTEKATNHDDLVCSTLNRTICDYLLATYHSIKHLKIRFVGNAENLLRAIAYLLDGWSCQLQSLVLDLDLRRHPLADAQLFQIITKINQMAVLKSLHLNFNPHHKSVRFDLPILGQLEEFTFDPNHLLPVTCILDSLIDYAMSNDKFKTIKLIHFYDDDTAERLFSLDAEFTRKFTFVDRLYMTGHQLALYAHKFTSLKYLCVDISNTFVYLSFDQVTALIATHMPQLEKLRLFLDFEFFGEDPLSCTPLPSVRKLSLQMHITSHSNIRKHLNPKVTFPNLERASTIIFTNHCSDCQIFRDIEPETMPACRALLERALEECPKMVSQVRHKDLI